MDSRLVLSVVFVTLCWGFMGTYAQSTTNGMMTTGNMATGNMTTGNMATGNMTTGNMATGNMTTGSMTTGSMTTGNNNVTTTAPPVSPNTTVVLLETPISRAGCGQNQLCAAEPAECDPSVPGSCFFLAARQQSGQNFEFALSGESEGYMAASLASTTPTDEDPTYVCANNNGDVQFFATVLNNGQLVETNLSVANVRGRVNGNQIQCTFTATVPISRQRTTAFSLSVSTGPFNATTGTLGTPTTVIRTPSVNLADVNATVANQVNATSAPTTAGNVTTSPATVTTPATAAPLVPLPVEGTLLMNISRTGCGSQKLCVAEPSECDPSIAGSCFFFSADQQSGQTFDFELSGQSTGYVAAALSTDTDTDGNGDIFYICANVNGSVAFFGATLDNNQLVNFAVNASSVNISISENQIQCEFQATVPDTTTRAASFSVTVANGTISVSGIPGLPSIQIRTNLIDLTNPNATFINLVNANSTTAPATTAHAVTHQRSLIPALLFTLVVLLFTTQGGN